VMKDGVFVREPEPKDARTRMSLSAA